MWRTQRVRRALLKRRDELLSRDAASEAARADATARASEAARAGEAHEWSTHVLTTLTERDLRELAGLIAAIHRIDEGTYGVCQHCDGRIERARLAEAPAATACRSCASDLLGQLAHAAAG